MIKKQLFILITFSMIFFVGCDDSSKKSYLLPEEDEIHLEVELERNLANKYPLDIILKITNMSDKTVYYDSFYAIAEDATSLNLFKVLEDGKPLEYTGAVFVKMGTDFISLASGESIGSTVAIDKTYKVTKGTHYYQISLPDYMLAKTSDGKTELIEDPKDTGMPLEPNQLPPGKHTSRGIQTNPNTLEFEATIKQIREPDYN